MIEGNTIDDVLFGITLQRANNNRIIGNRIRSRPDEPADRGDGIRLWFSISSRVENNDISRIRDITITNSLRNRFVANSVSDSRRALNLLFSHRKLIEKNLLTGNSTGITALNSDGLTIRNNRIMPCGKRWSARAATSTATNGEETIGTITKDSTATTMASATRPTRSGPTPTKSG